MNTTVFTTSLLIVAGQAIKITETQCKSGDIWDDKRGQCENFDDFMNKTGVYDPMGPEMTGYVDEWVPQTAEDCGPNQAFDSGMYSCYDIGSHYDPNYDPMGFEATGYVDTWVPQTEEDCGPNQAYDSGMYSCYDIGSGYDSMGNDTDFSHLTFDTDSSFECADFTYDTEGNPTDKCCMYGDVWDLNRGQCENYDDFMNKTGVYDPMGPEMTGYVDTWVPQTAEDCGPNQAYDSGMYSCYDIGSHYDTNYDPMGFEATGYAHGPSDCGPNQFYDHIDFKCLDIEENYDPSMNMGPMGGMDMGRPTSGCGHMEDSEGCCPGFHYSSITWMCTPDMDIEAMGITLAQEGDKAAKAKKSAKAKAAKALAQCKNC